jgi:hypothetical protein
VKACDSCKEKGGPDPRGMREPGIGPGAFGLSIFWTVATCCHAAVRQVQDFGAITNEKEPRTRRQASDLH